MVDEHVRETRSPKCRRDALGQVSWSLHILSGATARSECVSREKIGLRRPSLGYAGQTGRTPGSPASTARMAADVLFDLSSATDRRLRSFVCKARGGTWSAPRSGARFQPRTHPPSHHSTPPYFFA